MLLSVGYIVEYSYKKRDVHVPGNIYVFVAPEIHGWIPGFFVTRVKIGLTRKHPEERRQQIISNQPAHDLKIIKTVQVSDTLGLTEEQIAAGMGLIQDFIEDSKENVEW